MPFRGLRRGLDLDQDVAGADLLVLLELVLVRVVVGPLLRLRDRDPRLQLGQVEQEVGHDAALRERVAVLARVEARAHLGVGHGDRGRRSAGTRTYSALICSLRRRNSSSASRGLTITPSVTREATRSRMMRRAQLLLELAHADALHLQAAAQLVRAHEVPVDLELGGGGQALAERLVVDGDAEALRLELEHAVVDQRLQRLLLEAEALQHLVVHAPLVHALVHLALAQVRLLVLADGDRQGADLDEGRRPRRARPRP